MNVALLVLIIVILFIGAVALYVIQNRKKDQIWEAPTPDAVPLAKPCTNIMPRNGKGEAVDWFVVFKLPNHSKNCHNGKGSCADLCTTCECSQPSENCDFWNTGKSASGDRSSGECYYYADSTHPELTYYADLGYGCLSDSSSPLSQTMAQLTCADKWALWNDQGVTKSCSAPYAHSKGAIAFSSTGGFLLNTSTPHWPNADGQPLGCQKTSNTEYAQHMFCFSLTPSDATQWLKSAPNAGLCITESSFLPTKPFHGGNTPDVLKLKTKAGVPIQVIFKGTEDYYLPWSVVSGKLDGVNLKVASWTSDKTSGTSGWGDAPVFPGSGKLSQIVDVQTDKGCFPALYSFSHSKWGISDSGDWVIMGSMNMQNSQAKRGGDFYAFQNPTLWKSFNKIIQTVEAR